MPFLRYVGSDQNVVHVELDRETLTMGRSKECGLVVHDSSASRRHAEVRRMEGLFILVDLKSRNGTYVNGSPVSTWTLTDGDRITIGDLELVFKKQK